MFDTAHLVVPKQASAILVGYRSSTFGWARRQWAGLEWVGG